MTRSTVIKCWVFYCGRCWGTEHFTADQKFLAEADARRSSWSLTKSDGWVCPGCRSKAPSAPNPA